VPLVASRHNHVRFFTVGGEGSTPAPWALQSLHGAAARGPAQPGRTPPVQRQRALAEGDRALWMSGRRGIRTPCGLPRVSRGRRRSGAESGTRVERRGWRGGRAGAARGAGRLVWGSRGLGATEGTRGNVAAQGADGAGPAGEPGARPRVLPGARSMLLARRRSRRGRLSLFQKGVTRVTGTGTQPHLPRRFPESQDNWAAEEQHASVSGFVPPTDTTAWLPAPSGRACRRPIHPSTPETRSTSQTHHISNASAVTRYALPFG